MTTAQNSLPPMGWESKYLHSILLSFASISFSCHVHVLYLVNCFTYASAISLMTRRQVPANFRELIDRNTVKVYSNTSNYSNYVIIISN